MAGTTGGPQSSPILSTTLIFTPPGDWIHFDCSLGRWSWMWCCLMTLLQSRVMALSPSGQGDASVVIAGSRAGALGVFDYGFGDLSQVDARALRRASRFLKDRPFGLRLPARALS